MSKPRPPLPPMPYRTLNDWRFDDPNWWSYAAQAPLLFLNVSPVESWSGYAMSLAGLEPAWLVFPVADDNGEPNLNPTAGTVQFWFSPYWSSAGAGGKGPGRPAVLFELGAWSEKSATGWWSLEVALDGNSVALVAVGSVESAEVLRAPLAWRAGAWHQVTLNYYSVKATELYLDGALAAVGPGVALIPLSPSPGRAGFALGSAAFGGQSALGEFDELSTFIEPRRAADIANHYSMLKDRAALGPITPQEEARLLALAEAAARAVEQSATLDFETDPCGGPCEQLKICIKFLDPETYQNLQLTACGREPGVTYTWWSTPDLPDYDPPDPPPQEPWEWTAELRPEDAELVFLDLPGPRLFFQLVQSPHFYVSRYAAPGGDGSRDLPFDSLGAALGAVAVTDGAVIMVAPGVYSGSNNRDLAFGDKDVALIAERGWESTIIDCADAAGSHKAFMCATASEYTRGLVLGFTITNATQRALECSQGSRPRFANCAFSANSSSGDGGAIYCNNAQPTFLNCRFRGNSAANHGGAIYATGSQSLVRVSHCTFSDNARASGGGTLCAANGARMELTNCIVWSSFGTEIVTSGGGTVVAGYSDIAGTPLYPGTGNLNANPAFEPNGTLRLTLNSPCIDRGTTNTFIDCYVLVRHDMDGEARLDQPGENQISKVDIGADEFVYRLQFDPDENGYSEVDEASGVAYLGTVGQNAKFAVIDDETRTNLFIYELNTTGNSIINRVRVDITNMVHSGGSGVSNEEIIDLEGATYYEESGHRYLLVATSQTKRNRYRDVDHIASDPLIDPPSSDYDRRRNVMIRIELNAQYNPILDAQGRAVRTFWESENQAVPANTGYDANNGLIAYLRQQLNTQGAPYQEIDAGNNVLIAWNTINKFGTPQNGLPYTSGQRLPYFGGGPKDPGGAPPTAGTVLGLTAPEIQNGLKTLQNWATANTWYYFKIWAKDASGNYHEGPVSGALTDGSPRLFINEFFSRGTGTDWLEVYNPANRALDMGNISQLIGQLQFRIRDSQNPIPIPANSTIPGRGYLRFIRGSTPGANEVQLGSLFNINGDEDNIYLESTSTPPTPVDDYRFTRDQVDDVTEGRAWDGGPRRRNSAGICEGARFISASPYPPTALRPNAPAANHAPPFKHFFVTPDPDRATIYLEWAAIGLTPAVWRHSPKQHDFHPINLEGIAYRSPTEMIIGLRSPLSVDRKTGNALYFKVTNVSTPPNEFLPAAGGWVGIASGISGPHQLNLNGQGIRSIEWCPSGLLDANGQPVQRYLIIGGPANGGPLEKELFGQQYSLYSWTGNAEHAPQRLIADLGPYTVRPEGVDLILINGQWRVLFVEDRYRATGYGTHNAVHWPVSILGKVP